MPHDRFHQDNFREAKDRRAIPASFAVLPGWGLAEMVHDPIEGQIQVGQSLRVYLNLQHFQLLTPDRDIGHTGHGQQARPDLPVGDHTER